MSPQPVVEAPLLHHMHMNMARDLQGCRRRVTDMLEAGLHAFSLDEFHSALLHGRYFQIHCLHDYLVPCTLSLLPKLCLCSGNPSRKFHLQLQTVPHVLNGIQVGRARRMRQIGYPQFLPRVLSRVPRIWMCILFYHQY